MSSVIKDGTGKGHNLKIDKTNRAYVRSLNELEVVHAGEEGLAFNINTGLISVSADSSLIYLKNNESEYDLVVEALAIGSFEGITHSDDPYVTIIRNPTGGDLITDASAVSMNQNRNFSSSRNLTADVYKGKSSGTVTGGDDIAILQVNPATRSFYTLNFILPKGASIAVKLTANASSGSANYYAALVCYLKDIEVS